MTGTGGPADRGRLLRIYLNDHLTALVVGVHLVDRCLSNNGGTPLGATLQQLLIEFREDRAFLENVMDAVGAPVDRLKIAGGTVGERVGRLKPNGRLRGYSDLSRVVELESLGLDIDYKLTLWRTLRDVAERDDRLAGFDFDTFIERASSQLAEVERHRPDAAQEAFSSGAALP